MRFGAWPCPRAEVIFRCFRSELGDEIVGGLAETPICRERDGLEVDVKPFVLDDFVGRAALVVGVDVGGVTTGSLTRRVVDVSVDGGDCLYCRRFIGRTGIAYRYSVPEYQFVMNLTP